MSDIEKHLRHLREVGGRSNLEAARAIEALRGEVALLRRSLGKRQEQLEAAEQEAARLKGALVEQVKQYPDYSDICRKALAGGDA